MACSNNHAKRHKGADYPKDEMSDTDLLKLFRLPKKLCFRCGYPIDLTITHGDLQFTLDRIQNGKTPYKIGNVELSHLCCNTAERYWGRYKNWDRRDYQRYFLEKTKQQNNKTYMKNELNYSLKVNGKLHEGSLFVLRAVFGPDQPTVDDAPVVRVRRKTNGDITYIGMIHSVSKKYNKPLTRDTTFVGSGLKEKLKIEYPDLDWEKTASKRFEQALWEYKKRAFSKSE